MDRTVLESKALSELREIAQTLELRGYQRMKKADLVDLITSADGNGVAARPARVAVAERPAPSPAAPDASGGETEAPRVRARIRTTEDGAEGARGETAERTDAPRERTDRTDAPRERTDRPDRTDRPERDRGERTDGPRERDGDRGDDQGPGRNRNKRDRRRKGRTGGGAPGGAQGGAPSGARDPGRDFGRDTGEFDETEVREGILDLLPEGYGFLRCSGYLSGNRDVYVSQSLVRRYDLRRGDRISGPVRRNRSNEKFPALGRVDTLEGAPFSDDAPKRPEFKDLTPLFPNERMRLEAGEASPVAMRIVDMMAPIGKGQRGLIVSPPKAGKTMILKQLAHAIETNNPEVHLMVVLVDERPEEVTDFERSTRGEVISSTFDRPAEDHTQVAELTIERAKRLVERGRDVVILLDSITRLGRAYNLAAPASGRILSGGIDSAALYPPKRFFGAARNIEQGGSLTVIATALIETGSKMDEVIFEEFKGTGNMELRLDRRMEQKRIFPAVDIQASGTRREELLLAREELEAVWKLRRLLASMDSEAALQLLIDKLRATRSNEQFLQMIAKSS
jgi:transcription termination factor Rho